MAKTDNSKKEASETPESKSEEKPEKQEIEKLKYNVEKLSEELNTAVAELKRSIIDIRSAVSEIENPFNLLRVISSEKDLKKLNSERLPSGVKSLVLGKPEEKPEEKAEEGVPKPSIEMLAPLPKETLETREAKAKPLEEIREEPRLKAELPPSGAVYLDWVWSLLDLGFTPEDIKQISQSYERLGFMPEGVNEQVYSLAVAAEKAKSKGLTKSKLLLNMYKASVISGVRVGVEDVKRLIAIAEGRAAKARIAKRAV
ncbi:MAG: hypothetical protein QHH12_06535 [Candidatus Bathyarchaeota archaeon]|jgi:hypothetical protein|nr:hypothetical protein [Candidatus Bathyarchaeota archaeon A05DMB-3]MDH7607400.1 hypothetical protein [Candidatus Bathyarchaeota archaeon]